MPFDELLKEVEILSLHLPKNTKLLGEREFDLFGCGKILINTSLGLPFEEKAFRSWIKKDGNYAIFDGDGKKELSAEIDKIPNIITAKKSAGWSAETERRLSEKVVQNLKDFLQGIN